MLVPLTPEGGIIPLTIPLAPEGGIIPLTPEGGMSD